MPANLNTISYILISFLMLIFSVIYKKAKLGNKTERKTDRQTDKSSDKNKISQKSQIKYSCFEKSNHNKITVESKNFSQIKYTASDQQCKSSTRSAAHIV